ncbi:tRNA delta(2)-isopentenylpyrophosphate transferase [Caloranaerobacter azorensis H53214]|uniref:tRNA dimethylallyltransferase n=1 Tax=Caloranaerobacter azorensis H53214 TaxID=1156417 RepID=A0A096BGE7_9FIRM|nr:tRNA (adenosine(37)-N6)-dimethylallyltransferase MiaA [Caloranaerobacter azorensis]KGG80265.1 tRNA delta(2)-isopentenylpyrophosphate transferase [Caloranaerobacter azorensis H53214]
MNSHKKPLFVLIGPTAVGKTEISIELAHKLNGEIISADSMQIYKYMDIGTAKITEEEKRGIKHYLIDEIYPDQKFSVSDYKKLAEKYINEILNKGKLPIVVGGTGLYINSLVYELDFTNAVSNPEFRNEMMNKAKTFGNKYIHDELKKVDPISAERIHINDTKRIIRALEIYHETGKPMSHYYKNFRKPNSKYNIAMVGLTIDRKKLYNRINHRVDKMIELGLIDEVKNLLKMGYSSELTSMQGLGYKEIIAYLKGEYTLEEAINILKRDTRRFAKRQLTWFRRDDRIHWVNLERFNDKNEIVDYIVNYVRSILNF